MKKSILVIFQKVLSEKEKQKLLSSTTYDIIIAPSELHQEIRSVGLECTSLELFVEPGSIYEASALVEELSRLTMPDGTRLTKSFLYKGYELWWMYYTTLYLYTCLPYTQYKKLLAYLKTDTDIYLYQPPYESLFIYYFKAYGCTLYIIRKFGTCRTQNIPVGIFLQICITLLSLPILMLKRSRLMVFTSDLFEKTKDYDFRLKYIYEELRERKLPFVEFIRSLESWKNVFSHAVTRRRPVIYSEAITFIGRFVSILTGGQRRARQKFGAQNFTLVADTETRFKLLIATQYLLGGYDDIWAIRITKWVLRSIGVQSAFITATTDRNFHAVMGCKLNNISTVGILHGFASLHYNVYDFLPAYNGEKTLSVDKYGLWSEWWKEYYLKNSRIYREDQLVVSGPMRPCVRKNFTKNEQKEHGGPIKVLFISEQLAIPEEVIPYLEALLEEKEVSVFIMFRPYRDGFELWLKQYRPEIFHKISKDNILYDGIGTAFSKCDVVVGTHSTAVLEALFELKPIVLFATNKWGDYFSLKGFHVSVSLYAEDVEAFLSYIKKWKEIPIDLLENLQKRYFGNPYQNGSNWVVEQMISKSNKL